MVLRLVEARLAAIFGRNLTPINLIPFTDGKLYPIATYTEVPLLSINNDGLAVHAQGPVELSPEQVRKAAQIFLQR